MLTKHDGAGAMVSIQQSNPEVIPGLKLKERRRVQGYGFLEM